MTPPPFQQGLHLLLAHLRSSSAKGLAASSDVLARLSASAAPPPTGRNPPAVFRQTAARAASAPSAAVAAGDPLPDRPGDIGAAWQALRDRVGHCTLCPQLAATRTQTVFGVGDENADLFFVGEAPGADEDRQGEPFVGLAGEILTKIISAMQLSRQTVFIANVLKCRPDTPPGTSGNRPPRPEEMAACLPYLREQIALVRPKILVALGGVAMRGLFGDGRPIGQLRGRWHDFFGIPTMATYHPAFLLRNSGLSYKRKVWEDMLQVLERLELPISERQHGFFQPKS